MYTQLIQVLDNYKDNLINYSTGKGEDDSFNYIEMRKELLTNSLINSRIPDFIKQNRNIDEFWSFIKITYATYEERRVFLRKEFNDLINSLEEKQLKLLNESDRIKIPLDKSVQVAYINDTWSKAVSRVNEDPEGAITISRTLLEEIMKFILVDANVVYKEDSDLPSLYKRVSRMLNLAPDQHTEKVFKQILGGCTSVVIGLGTVRNKHGDSHGNPPLAAKPSSRHAKLAVNLAGAMGEFIMQTYLDKGVVTEAEKQIKRA